MQRSVNQIGDWQVIETPSREERARVLLLPGGFCTALSYVDLIEQPQLIDGGVTTLAVNPPGFGGNPIPPGFECSTSEYAALTEAFASQQGIDLIVGHSMFGNILIEVAARGEHTGPLMLLGPCLRFQDELRGVQKLRRLDVNDAHFATTAWKLANRGLKGTMRGLVPKDRLKLVADDMKRNPFEANRKVINGYFDHLAEWGTLANRLEGTTNDVYYVRGDRERIGFNDEDRERISAMPNVKLCTVADADHFTMLDNPAAVATLINEQISNTGSVLH